MNLSIKNFLKTGLLLLIALFFITCKKENHTIGLDSANRLDASTLKIDTFTITSSVFLANDSIVSSFADSILLCGAYTDPEFGKISAETYTQIRLKSEFVELTNAVVDSGYLFLDYHHNFTNLAHYSYGDTNQVQTLNVYPLTADLNTTVTYYTSSPAISYSGTALGSATFVARPNSGYPISVKITDNTYLQNILDGPKQNASFKSQFKGLAIIPSNSNGAILRINRFSANTYLRIYYKLPGSTASRYYDLVFDISTQKFYRLVADRSLSSLSSLSSQLYVDQNTSSLYQKGYIQTGTGIFTKISFPSLKNFLSTIGSINIHGAILQVTASGDTTRFPIIKGFELVEIDSTNNHFKRANASYLSSIQSNGYAQTGYYYPLIIGPSTTGVYSFTISDYIQALYLKKKGYNSLAMLPYYSYNYNSGSVDRLVFGDNSNSSNPMKLILYYTTVK